LINNTDARIITDERLWGGNSGREFGEGISVRRLIITDSNCDLSTEYIKENNIPIIPFHFHLKGKEYEDNFGESISYKDFYDELRNGEMSTTAQIIPDTFEEVFKKYVSEGYSIIYIGFSSALSETYNNAVLAKETIMKEYKTADITVIDSKSATVGQGLLVYYACEMLKQGISSENIIDWIEDNKLYVNHWFTVDSLEHLRRGGRISPANAALGTLLEVKPILIIDKEGRLITVKKVRGRKRSIKILLEEFRSRVIHPEEQVVFICHGDCLEDAELLKSLVTSKVKVKDVVISFLSPIIGTHTGPGFLCIIFIGRDRQE
jgi:DegV family protein with EDD domain